jgi:hypothetical protein
LSANKELSESFKELSIKNQKQAPAPKSFFKYEPALYSNRLVKAATGGIGWHDLSPQSRHNVN